MQWVDIKTRLKGWLQYLWAGKSRYHVHSPFVFDLINKVLRDKRPFYDLQQIDDKRLQLLADNSKIAVKEFTDSGSAEHQTTLARLVYKTAMPKKYGELLFRLVNYYKVKNILEVGTGTGISTAYLACADRTGSIISLEGDPARAAIAEKVLADLNAAHVNISTGNFDDTLIAAVQQLERIDMAFIDGNHRKEPTLQYFNTLLPGLHNNSLVVVDDIYWSAEMNEAWQQLQQHPRVTLSIDLYRVGLLFFTPDFKQPQHHRLYY